MENAKRYRVPHCKVCDRCQSSDYLYKEYYCSEANEPSVIYALLGVDNPPKTSPKWCPKRNRKGSDNNDISGRYGRGYSKKDRIPKVQNKNIS